jgi:hypothetical protein
MDKTCTPITGESAVIYSPMYFLKDEEIEESRLVQDVADESTCK